MLLLFFERLPDYLTIAERAGNNGHCGYSRLLYPAHFAYLAALLWRASLLRAVRLGVFVLSSSDSLRVELHLHAEESIHWALRISHNIHRLLVEYFNRRAVLSSLAALEQEAYAKSPNPDRGHSSADLIVHSAVASLDG